MFMQILLIAIGWVICTLLLVFLKEWSLLDYGYIPISHTLTRCLVVIGYFMLYLAGNIYIIIKIIQKIAGS